MKLLLNQSVAAGLFCNTQQRKTDTLEPIRDPNTQTKGNCKSQLLMKIGSRNKHELLFNKACIIMFELRCNILQRGSTIKSLKR